MFFGWHFDPGAVFHGDYRVMRLADFETDDADVTPHVYRVKEVTLPNTVRFPFREIKDKLWLSDINPSVTDPVASVTRRERMEFDAPDEETEVAPKPPLIPADVLSLESTAKP